MIWGLLIQKINVLIISGFFYVNYLIKKVAHRFFDANKAQNILIAYANSSQSKNLAMVKTSGFIFWQLDYIEEPFDTLMIMLLVLSYICVVDA